MVTIFVTRTRNNVALRVEVAGVSILGRLWVTDGVEWFPAGAETTGPRYDTPQDAACAWLTEQVPEIVRGLL